MELTMIWDDISKSNFVEKVFSDLLGRSAEPEAIAVLTPEPFDPAEVVRIVTGSAEFLAQYRSGPFYTYNSMIDVDEIILRHAAPDIQPEAGVLVNYLGVKIDPKYLPSALSDSAGTVEGTPIPANWHADMAEWAAALRAVDLAQDTFTVAELGCGWGCWINNTGVAARRAGLKVQLIGVEGDEGHVQFAQECCAANGFSPDQLTIYRGVAAASSGTALFPNAKTSGENYALEPVFAANSKQLKTARASGNYDELPMIPLAQVVGPHKKLDLLHIDIQGGEVDLIKNSLKVLRERVAYMVIGTHSREIDGLLVGYLRDEGWRLEVERPAIIDLTVDGPRIDIDGVQGWRNMALRPD